jgi:magnesium transporter
MIWRHAGEHGHVSRRHSKRRSSEPGSPPGHPIVSVSPDASGARVSWCRYSETTFEERTQVGLEQALAGIDPGVVDWLHFSALPEPTALRWLHERLGLSTLALEDVYNGQQRTKIEPYDGHAFLVVSVPVLKEGSLTLEQFSLFVGPHWIVSFWSGEQDLLAPVRQRLRNSGGRIRRRQADYLCYCLLDVAVDACFPVLEELRERIEALEEQLLERPRPDLVGKAHGLRRELTVLRRLVLPGQEALEQLLRADSSPLGADTRVYIRDVLDHQLRISDSIDSLAEMTRGLHELHLMNAGQRLNEVMRLLTIIATIFIPLTFIAGVYGMNFDPAASPWNMPELEMRYGYPAVLLLFVAIGLGMLWMFRRKGWF